MRVVLVNPPVEHGRYKSWQSSIPPAGLGYLAAYLEENHIPCDIIDGKLDGLTLDEVCEKISSIRPDVIGLSAMTPDITVASKIARRVKTALPGSCTVLGGPHAIAMPKETLKDFPEIDFVANGEGEITLVELIRALSGNREFHRINGLGFRNGSEIVINPPREYIRDLDRLPYPAWNKFSNNSGVYFILSARGCPYRCAFCMRALGRTVRDRTPENVVDEIEWLVSNYHPQKIIFIDETFTLKKDKVLKITDFILERGLEKKIRWVAQTRIDRGDPEVFARMKRAGCEKIEFGVESGNQEILNRVDKNLTLPQISETIRTARDNGLLIACSFILGHPYETRETIQDTIDLAVKLKPDFVSFGVMCPYPGTKIWEMAQKSEGNYRLLSTNWEDFVRFGGGCLELSNLSRHTLEVLQIKAYVSFYVRTLKLLRFFQYILPRWKQARFVIKKLFLSA